MIRKPKRIKTELVSVSPTSAQRPASSVASVYWKIDEVLSLSAAETWQRIFSSL